MTWLISDSLSVFGKSFCAMCVKPGQLTGVLQGLILVCTVRLCFQKWQFYNCSRKENKQSYNQSIKAMLGYKCTESRNFLNGFKYNPTTLLPFSYSSYAVSKAVLFSNNYSYRQV